MVGAGRTKGALPAKDLLIRGFLSGALLGFATSLAITATVQTGVPLVGALYLTYGQKKEANPAAIAPSAIAEPGPVS